MGSAGQVRERARVMDILSGVGTFLKAKLAISSQKQTIHPELKLLKKVSYTIYASDPDVLRNFARFVLVVLGNVFSFEGAPSKHIYRSQKWIL